MQFLESILFTKDIVLRTSRDKHLSFLSTKTKKRKVQDRRKPIRDNKQEGRRQPWSETKYETVTVTDKYLKLFEQGLHVWFDDITIIVGDNGSGKSTLLDYLQPPSFNKSLFVGLTDKTDEERYAEAVKEWLNSEDCRIRFKANPELIVIQKDIHKGAFISAIGKGKHSVSAQEIFDRWSLEEHSNGETTIDFLASISKLTNSLIVLDEPETSLSIKSQIKQMKQLKTLSKQNQLVIVTHSPIFMKLARRVYDFEKKQWVEAKQYIQEQFGSFKL
jgi:predicted ATPase